MTTKRDDGHPDFVAMCLLEMETHNAKNRDYAQGGHPLGNFNRVAGILGQYPGLDVRKPEVVALVYLLKQLDAALWMVAQGYEGQVEDVAARLRDVSIYAKLASILHREGGKPVNPICPDCHKEGRVSGGVGCCDTCKLTWDLP